MKTRGIFLQILLLLLMNACSGGSGSDGNTNEGNGGFLPEETNETIEVNMSSDPLYQSFNVGVGIAGAYPFKDDTEDPVWLSSADLILNDKIDEVPQYQAIQKFDGEQFASLQAKLKNTKYVVYWLTKYWEESWISVADIQKLMDSGYVPIFNYWYFADALSGGLPDREKIEAYVKHNTKVVAFLAKLKGQKIVIMEPEFNKDSVVDAATLENKQAFATILGDAIDTIRSGTEDTLFSLSMMDSGQRSTTETFESCGYSPCALGDKKRWSKVEPVYSALLSKLDFVSFSEMLGQFSRDHNDPGSVDHPNPRAYSQEELGIAYLDSRIINLSHYMKEKYHKPVFLSHITIATATWSDENSNGSIENDELDLSGWESVVDTFYRNIMDRKDECYASGLFGFAVMGLFDNPQNDIKGYQYFLNNEYHLGIIKTSAIDEVDKYLMGDIVFKGNMIDTLFSK